MILRVMGLLKTLKDSDIALFFFVSLLIAQPLFYYQNFDNNFPKIDFDVNFTHMIFKRWM